MGGKRPNCSTTKWKQKAEGKPITEYQGQFTHLSTCFSKNFRNMGTSKGNNKYVTAKPQIANLTYKNC